MPANPMRGEADFGPHKLVVTFNGWCALEAATGKRIGDLLLQLQIGLGFLDMRTWVRIFIDKEMTGEEAGDLIGNLGVDVTLEALSKAVEAFFPVQVKIASDLEDAVAQFAADHVLNDKALALVKKLAVALGLPESRDENPPKAE